MGHVGHNWRRLDRVGAPPQTTALCGEERGSVYANVLGNDAWCYVTPGHLKEQLIFRHDFLQGRETMQIL